MEGSWLVLIGGLVLSVVQLAVGVFLGRILFLGRQKAHAASSRDIERVRTFTSRLYHLMTGVAGDVDRHQVRIQQISKELAAVQKSTAPDAADVVLERVMRLIEVNGQLQKQLRTAEEKLDRQAAQIEIHVLEARVDPMTGLLNRGAFDEALISRTADWQLHRLSFCLVMLDLDQFKSLNDQYGHLAGDAALRHVAELLREELADIDLIARLGGDEFAVLLPRTALADAQETAQRICSRIASSGLVFQKHPLAVSVSLGLAVVQAGDDAVSMMKRADDALYASKRAGRNRAHFHDGRRCLPLGRPSLPADHTLTPAPAGPIDGPAAQTAEILDPEAVRNQIRQRLRKAIDLEPPDPTHQDDRE